MSLPPPPREHLHAEQAVHAASIVQCCNTTLLYDTLLCSTMPYTTHRGNSTTDCITAPHDSLLHHNVRYACGASTTHKRDDAETNPTTCTGADWRARARVRPPPGVPPLRARASGAACALAWHRPAQSAPASFKQTISSSLSVWIDHLNLVEKFASDGSFARARVRPARVRYSARVARHPVEPARRVHRPAHTTSCASRALCRDACAAVIRGC